MAHTATAPLAAAVTNAGGLGTIGGLGYTPAQLRSMIQELKELLRPSSPSSSSSSSSTAAAASSPAFGIDLALPQVGGNARKTNHDYTHGQLDELVTVIVEEGAALFVSAVGVPPARVVQKLHDHGILVMNMVGHPRHAEKAFDAGVDIVCAQGGEGGGHTGEIPMGILVPACVDVARRYRPPLLSSLEGESQRGMVVAAGGIWDGRGLAGALAMGAAGVWVGTRFVASTEAHSSDAHKQAVVDAGWADTVRTLVVTGRPLRVKRNAYIDAWHARENGTAVARLTAAGIVPLEHDFERTSGDEEGKGEGEEEEVEIDTPFLMGQVAAVIQDVRPAADIVADMAVEAAALLRSAASCVNPAAAGGGRESKL